MPVLAHARHLAFADPPISCEDWIDAMTKAAGEARADLEQAKQGSGTSATMSTA
jgi:hypothetical protein